MSQKKMKKESIFQAAEEEFLENGFQGARMENIAKRAEVSKRTLYKYYPSKEDVYEALVEKLFSEVDQALPCEFDSSLGIEVMIEKIVANKLNLLINPDFLNLSKVILQKEMVGKKIDPKMISRLDQGQVHFYEWLEKCRAAGLLRGEFHLDEINLWFHSLVEGLLMWPLILGIKSPPQGDEIDDYKYMIVNSFLKTYVSKNG